MMIALLFGLALVQAPAVSPQEVWPPPGVLTAKDGITRASVISQVAPKFTEAAIRRRIQGFATLQFVVEVDGTVGPVRVLTSLDAASGLDDAAIVSLKQWRFTPATKDGVAVRSLAIATVTFNLNGVPPPITLPAGFAAAPDDARAWSKSEVTAGGVRIQFEYPEGWQVSPSPAMALMMADPKTRRTVGIYRPAPLPRPLPFPMPLPELARFAGTMRGAFARGPIPSEVLGVGQSALGAANWLWIELDLADTARAWAFTTTVGSQMVQVLCTVETPTLRMTEADRDAALAGGRIDCANVLKRLTLSVAAPNVARAGFQARVTRP